MTARQWTICGLQVCRFGDEKGVPAIYVHAGHEEAAALAQCDRTVIAVENADWNRDLTPWPAKAVFRGRPDFSGGAGIHLRRLEDEILPAVEQDLQPSERWIIGYSLAGMFAVYAALETALFSRAASVSGSLWYQGFAEYVEASRSAPQAAYFSVGDRERLGRNPAFRSIEDCTCRVETAFRSRGARTIFERNPGGHFDHPVERMERAIRWLMQRGDEGHPAVWTKSV